MDPPRIAADAGPVGPCYRFDGVVVDEGAHTIHRHGEPLALEPKVFAVLLVLLRHRGELLERDDLMDAVWGHRHVTPGVLTRAIAQLRHALGDDPHQPRYIQTQHALGYRFIGQLLDPDVAPAHAAQLAAYGADGMGAVAEARPQQPESSPLLQGEPGRPDPANQTSSPMQQAAAGGAAADPAAAPASAYAGRERRSRPAVEPGPPPRAAPPTDRRRPGSDSDPDRAMRLAVPALLGLGLGLTLVLALLAWLSWDTRQPTRTTPAGKATAWAAAPPALEPPPASIAVLSFTSFSDDRNDTNFAHGLAEEMHNILATVPGLQVAARPTAADAASAPADIKALGPTLGVATVLDASVRREDERIRIHARLIDTDTGYTLWSDSYDRESQDLLALETEIATEVVQALLGVLRATQPGIGSEDGITCSLGPIRGRVYIDIDYSADTLPSVTPDRCELERGSTITWRGPPAEAEEFSVIFNSESPEGARGDRVVASERIGSREKITMTAGNELGSYEYHVEAFGRRADSEIVIRRTHEP